MTQKRDYMKPTMNVVEVRIESHLLAGSTKVDAKMENEWEEVDL